jgi:hypothetical protein
MTTETLTPIINSDFGLMKSPVSSERSAETQIKNVARCVTAYGEAGCKNVAIASHQVIECGAVKYLERLVKDYFIQRLAVDNSLALADLREDHQQGIELMRQHHTIRRAVEAGELTNGLLTSCCQLGIRVDIFASIEDEENQVLEEAITDTRIANKTLTEFVHGVDLLLILGASELAFAARKVASLNTKVVAVDLDFSAVQKLCLGKEDVAIITDVGLFLRFLSEYIYS